MFLQIGDFKRTQSSFRIPLTSSYALNNATLPFGLALANKGVVKACEDDPHLAPGLNVHQGRIVNDTVAESLGFS